MIITRTPFRLALAGGGTDFKEFYKVFGGQIVSFTFDKYCYISIRNLPEFFEHKHRIVYQKIEMVNDLNDITHPAVKAVLKKKNIHEGLEIHHDGDLPARSGVGSSSAFVVGLLAAVNEYKNLNFSQKVIAEEAIFVEQKILKENVGIQDQIACTYGGLNNIKIQKNGKFVVEELKVSENQKIEIENSLLLVYSRIERNSSDIHAKNVKLSESEFHELMLENLESAALLTKALKSNKELSVIGDIFNSSWEIKKRLNPFSITTKLEEMRKELFIAGARGIKIMGAGGGGFFAVWIDKEKRNTFIKKLQHLTIVPIKIESNGVQIIFNNQIKVK